MADYIIEVLSPIHIGNGRYYTSMEHLVREGTLTRFDLPLLYKDLDEEQREEFLIKLEGFDFKPSQYFKTGGCCQSGRMYEAEIAKGHTPQEVLECVKSCQCPYIPGSSIKGFLRTAVSYALSGSLVMNAGKTAVSTPDDYEAEEFAKRVLGSRASDTGDLRSSPFRFLEISDSSGVELFEIICEKTLIGARGHMEWRQSGTPNAGKYLEALPVKSCVKGTLNITYDDATYGRLGLRSMFDLLNPKMLAESAYTFSKDFIEHECAYAERNSIDFLSKFYEELRAKNQKNAPVLRLGRGIGFLMATLRLKLKNRDKDAFEQIRRLMPGRSYEYEFPKTRKIDVDKRMPLGWCRLVIK
jgi:CRISPR-associated protein Csm5